jgi:cytidine deaminase
MDLFLSALKVMENAYVPYSNFKVGVCILSEDGNLYLGCNVENAAYPQGLCAEAGAISAMISGGSKVISKVLVVADSKNLITPCGGCRQKLNEFSNKETTIFLADLSGIRKELRLIDLLPGAFDKTFFK